MTAGCHGIARRGLLAWAASLWLATPRPAGAQAAPVMLANVYRPGIDLSDYWVSEKYDGLRGYWDGRRLWTRGGEPVNAPAWFTAGWPTVPMDGELWAGRGRFEQATSTVRRLQPDDEAWRTMRFMVFDLPAHGGLFDTRLAALQALLHPSPSAWLQAVPQRKVGSDAALQALLREVIAAGAEGLMLHRGASAYRAERSDDLLKLKTHDDADARVIAHLPGKGKYTGQLGALQVETPEGLRFSIGSGLTDAQRRAPPAVGSWISYRYRGLHDSGLPRFATFLRERPDLAAR
ncbi:MAG: DNA ligase [Burkholderiales bacterium]|nr:DNA ligase [Burkholderiales bacterium]